MIRLALTGSIGMGKSATAAMFAARGIPVYDADAAVHAAYAPGGEAVAPIEWAFPGVIGEDGGIDRAKLRGKVAKNPDAMKKLESIVHPIIAQANRAFLEKAIADKADIIVLDIPLLFETGGEKRVDVIAVVTAPPDVQRQRVMARGQMTEAEFEAILARQVPDSVKRERADFVINTGLGMTASFSTMLVENRTLVPGALSMVSQSGGLAVMAHARAQSFGLGFRVTASVGNEAVLGIADFVHALVDDDGTRVIAVYAEGLADPDAFVGALAAARAREKPVVVLKGGASDASSRAALAHTGRLAGSGRTFDAICREFAVIRVHSTEELLDVGLSLAALRPGQLPASSRVLVSSFGGGSGVVCTDQCERAGLTVPALSPHAQATLEPLVTPLSSVANPIDFTPGMMTTPKHRATMPAALDVLADLPEVDAWLFLAAGFDKLAPEVVELVDRARTRAAKPMLLTWQAMPAGTPEALAARGLYVFDEHDRAVRALRHIVGYAAALRSRVRRADNAAAIPFPWQEHVPAGDAPQDELLEHHAKRKRRQTAALQDGFDGLAERGLGVSEQAAVLFEQQGSRLLNAEQRHVRARIGDLQITADRYVDLCLLVALSVLDAERVLSRGDKERAGKRHRAEESAIQQDQRSALADDVDLAARRPRQSQDALPLCHRLRSELRADPRITLEAAQ